MTLKLLPFQEVGRDHLASRKNAALFDDMGLGKTPQTIAAFNKVGPKKTIIVCPSALRTMWYACLMKWSDKFLTMHIVRKQVEMLPSVDVIIVSYDLLVSPAIERQLKKRDFDLIILDECQYAKNTKAKCTKIIYNRGGLMGHSSQRWVLSGSPLMNRPYELYPMLRTLAGTKLGKYKNWMSYIRKFCAAYKGPWGLVYDGASNHKLLHKIMFGSGFALRRMKEDELEDFPEKVVRLVPLEQDEKAKRIEVQYGQTLRKSDISKKNLGLAAGELAVIRKEVALAKLDACIEYLNHLLATNEKVVVFAWHKEVIEAVHKSIKVESVVYYGSTSMKKKDEAKKAFIKGKARLFIANIKSGGTGLDGLQTVCNTSVFIEPDWSPENLKQAIDRLHRMLQTKRVEAIILVLLGSAEEYILSRVLKKQADIQVILGD